MPYKNWDDKRRNDKRYYEQCKEARGGDAPFLRKMIQIQVKGPAEGLRVAVLTDGQIRPGVPVDHWTWVGKYLARQRPHVILQIGDISDMPSLGTHEALGSLKREGLRYKKDLDAVNKVLDLFGNELAKANGYTPELLETLGNHEDRIPRAVNSDPRLEGMLSIDDIEFKEHGWKVFPFLQPITVGGVAFCHYFPSGVKGQPIGAAKTLLNKLHMSAFAGHLQGRDIAYSRRADGQDMTAIISGSFYQHEETYLSPFTNGHWRGMYMLHEVKDGSFDEMAVSMSYLKRKFQK
jgi:hypothetical protein